jgi:hypothetical protein
MRSSSAIFAILAVSLWSAQADIEDAIELDEETLDMIDGIVDTIQEKLYDGNELQLFGSDERRLAALGEFPAVSYATMCTGACWNNLLAAFQNSISTLDGSTCKNKAKVKLTEKFKDRAEEGRKEKAARDTSKSGSAGKERGGRRLAKPDFAKQESSCIFDICPRIKMACNATNVTGAARNESSRIKDQYNNMDNCTASNINFLCNSVCSADCWGDVNMKKMLCGATGKAQGGKYSTDKNGGDLKKMFNMMCTKDPDGNYCYDKIKASITADNFEVNKNGKGFPNPCTIDCSSTAATAVTGLGCCFPAVMDAQKRYKVMTKGQTRMLKAIASRCGDNASFTPCTAGPFQAVKSKRVAISANLSCDDLSSEAAEGNFTELLTSGVNGTSIYMEVLQCVAKGQVCAALSSTTTTAADTTSSGARRLYAEDADEYYARRLSSTQSDLTVNIAGDESEVDAAVITAALIADASAVAETSDGETTTGAPANTGQVGGAFACRPILAVLGALVAFLVIVGK